MTVPSTSTPSAPITLMQSPSQADVTVKDLRTRMGEDVGLLSYLPCEKVRTASFHHKGETGHPLPIRILFGKIKHKKSDFMEVWALLHNKPGSSRSPEVRLKLFTRQGQLEGPIALEEAMEQAWPAAAFTSSKMKNARFDRAHLSAIMRYYFILQKIQLPSPWPISDIFIMELKSACRIAKANAEGNLLQPKSFVSLKSPKPVVLPQTTVSLPSILDIRPEDLITSLRQNVAENEARDRRLAENENRRDELEAELEDLKEEAVILKNALQQSKSERRHLRSSLSKRDLAFLQLGQDLMQGGGKRLRLDDSDKE
ncbi:hypothetical protein N0V95_006528 [Ascochyta clinopodiicola]|nr:hypothetical protein N0V95_006528 [Ascochyta clinopodiicola]